MTKELQNKLYNEIPLTKLMEIKIQDIKYNREIVKIYNWIYEGGNTTDKAIIARNIISLHCKYSSILNLDGKTFSSIQSNFNLYQKDNVDRYLSYHH